MLHRRKSQRGPEFTEIGATLLPDCAIVLTGFDATLVWLLLPPQPVESAHAMPTENVTTANFRGFIELPRH